MSTVYNVLFYWKMAPSTLVIRSNPQIPEEKEFVQKGQALIALIEQNHGSDDAINTLLTDDEERDFRELQEAKQKVT